MLVQASHARMEKMTVFETEPEMNVLTNETMLGDVDNDL